MKRKSIFRKLYPLLLGSLVLFTIMAHAQEERDSTRHKSIFVEFAGSGMAIVTANFDMRFNKGRNDGLGIRVGVGGGSITTSDYIIADSRTKTKMFSVPLEVNYILGQRKFSLEVGYSITYTSITEDYYSNFLGMVSEEHRSDNVMVSYLPVGFRLKPNQNGFLLKLNIGPVFNYSAPNLFSDNSTEIWGGFAVGYSFY